MGGAGVGTGSRAQLPDLMASGERPLLSFGSAVSTFWPLESGAPSHPLSLWGRRLVLGCSCLLPGADYTYSLLSLRRKLEDSRDPHPLTQAQESPLDPGGLDPGVAGPPPALAAGHGHPDP